MKRLSKKRTEDTFRDGQETKFRKFLRTWLNWTGAGICRTGRNENPKNTARTQKPAREPEFGIYDPKTDSFAELQPGEIDLLLALRRREQRKVRFEHPTEAPSDKEAQK
jgi:hypothetical protein